MRNWIKYLVALSVALGTSGSAFGAFRDFDVGDGDWDVSSNWELGAGPLPGSGDSVRIAAGYTATIKTGVTGTAAKVTLGGFNSAGTLIVDAGGTLLTTIDSTIATSRKTGTLDVSGTVSMGTGNLLMGGGNTSTGTILVKSGAVVSMGAIILGNGSSAGTYSVTQTGGAVSLTGDLVIADGDDSASSGTYTISGGSLSAVRLDTGGNGTSTAKFSVDGSAATNISFSGTSYIAGNTELGFILDAAGVSALDMTAGGYTVASTAFLTVDGSAYDGSIGDEILLIGTDSAPPAFNAANVWLTNGYELDYRLDGLYLMKVEPTPIRDIQSDTWVAVDALGRALPDYEQVGGQNTNRTVGMFYFIWHSQHTSQMNGGPYDIGELLTADPVNTAWGPEGSYHHWAEPEVGYFRADDPYVIRRNASMLVDAGVDVIFFDVTNSFTYQNIYTKICQVYMQIRAKGGKTPQIAFITHSNPEQTVNSLYNNFYSQNLYPELWFYWKGKPLLLADTKSVTYSATISNFFNLRHSWAWGSTAKDDWSWLDYYPQDYAWHESSDRPEQVSVSVAQHATTSIGRSYSNGTQPAVDQYHLTGTEGDGIYFDEQWTRAHSIDPEFIYVTGWNEWIALRSIAGSAGKFAGRDMPAGHSVFVDVFNEEFNRDIDPMKGGHTDNYYYQLISNIRKYKGVRPGPVADAMHTISVDGLFDEWASVSSVYYDTYGDPVSRDWPGWGDGGLTYTNQTGRNDILESRVVHDGTDLGFYVETATDLTSFNDPHWMELFINSDQDHTTGWEGYDYRISGYAANGTAVVDHFNGTAWVAVGTADYKESGNKMELSVSRATLGLTVTPVSFDFHWADNMQSENDITEFFINGDSAPNRRSNYRYKSHAIVETTLRTNGFETGIAYGDWEISSAQSYSGAHSLECSEDDNVGLSESLATEGLDSFRVSFKYKLKNVEALDNLHVHYEVPGVGFVQVGDLGAENGVWLHYTDVRYNIGADADFFTNGPINFHINGQLMTESNEFLYIDDLEITGYSVSGPPPSSPSEKYEIWAALFGLDINSTGAMAFDYESDGLDNLTEYALGGNPTNNDAASVLPVFQPLENYFYYVHHERTDDTSLTYTVELTDDLVNANSNGWETGDVEFVEESALSDVLKIVTNRIPTLGKEQQFIRLKIEQQ